ncbi:MAG: Gfo/Idh/MocA family oxidoreductase [Thaumarchaeota archaeon]|nr:Gfo/Idh/MocA family oxidoreductase [Nitrososphaerota archaeon]
MDKQIGLGLIGAGAIGRVHAKNIHEKVPNATLAAVADIDQKAAGSIAEQCGHAKVYSDYADMLRDDSVHAVVLCVPPFLKLEITKAAAQVGKHVFCEKPMALSMQEADEMVSTVDKHGIRFQVGYQRRFDPSYVKARWAVETGKLGKLLMVKEYNRDPPGPITGWSTNPKRSGGIFLDTTSHDFDAVRWLAGSEVVRVYAEGEAMVYEELKKNGDFDTVQVMLKLANGALGFVDNCYHTVYGFDGRLEILGTQAAVSTSLGESTFAHIYTKDGASNEFFDGYATRWAQAYLDELVDFVQCIISGRETRATVRDGRAAVEIGLAARASIEQQKPVSLPFR